jgi:polyisoprenyl-phosphate glycosyltransferase
MNAELEKKFVSTVVYCHNDAASLEGFLEQVGGFLTERYEQFEIVVVNDWSTDNSASLALEIGSRMPKGVLTVLNLSFTHGTEAALAAGIDCAIGDYVYEFETMNVDYPLETLAKVHETCLEGCDIVAASPDRPTRFWNKVFFAILNRNTGAINPFGSETFRIISRRAINRIGMTSGRVVYRKAVYYGCGLKTKTVFYDPVESSSISSSRSKVQELNLAIDTLLHFTNLGFKLSMSLTLAMMSCSLLGLVYAVSVYLIRKHIVEGWFTTMVFLSFGFFGMFAILAVIVKYLSLVLEATHRKTPYQFESIVKSNPKRA